MSYPGPFPFKVEQGGTGDVSLAANAVLIGDTADQITVTNVGTDGQVIIGKTGGSPAFATLTSTGGSITFTPGPNSLNLETSGGGSITTVDGDTSSASGATINIITGFTSGPYQNGTLQFNGDGASTLTLNTKDALNNLGVGYFTLSSVASGGGSTTNTAFGNFAGASIVGGGPSGSNCLFGQVSGGSITQGASNMAFGTNSLGNLLTGLFNIGIGDAAGNALVGAESSNIYFNSPGVAAESNTLRIGSGTGSTNTKLNAAYISGIDGVNVGSVAKVVTMASDQLGTADITAGSGISVTPGANTITIAADGSVATTYDADSGSATPAANTIHIVGGTNVTTSASGSTITINASATTSGAVVFEAQSGGAGTLNKGTLVYVNGSGGGLPFVAPADSSTGGSQAPAVGMVLTTVGVGVTGLVQISGIISGIDTSGVAQGAVAYLGSAGAFQQARPTGNNYVQTIGTCAIPDVAAGVFILDIPSDVVKVPNITSNNIWVGSSTALPTETALANGVLTYDTTGHAFSGSALTQHSLLAGGASNAISSLGVATNGQLPIGSTGADPVLATITAGTGISVTNGAGSITIANTATGMAFVDVTGTSQTMAANTIYLADNAGLVTLTLPASCAQGAIIRVGGNGAGGWTIAQNGGQSINFGVNSTTVGGGGSLSSTNRYDGVELICSVANTTFNVLSSQGNLTVV